MSIKMKVLAVFFHINFEVMVSSLWSGFSVHIGFGKWQFLTNQHIYKVFAFVHRIHLLPELSLTCLKLHKIG